MEVSGLAKSTVHVTNNCGRHCTIVTQEHLVLDTGPLEQAVQVRSLAREPDTV